MLVSFAFRSQAGECQLGNHFRKADALECRDFTCGPVPRYFVVAMAPELSSEITWLAMRHLPSSFVSIHVEWVFR